MIDFYEDNGFRIQQHPDCKRYFQNYLLHIKPSRILELGTANGGLTYLLRSITSMDILTVDKDTTYLDRRVYNYADILTGDFYDTAFQHKHILPYINQKGTTLILCDGFEKVKQYNTYVKFIKTNDVIAVHDYFKTRDYYEKEIKGKTWNWCMITDEDMQASNSKYKMENNYTKINDIFWVSKIKKGTQDVVNLI